MTNIVLSGTEVLQVLPIQTTGAPAASTGQTTTQDIANLAPGNLSSLASGKVFVGSAGNVATARTLSGDISVSNTGVVTAAGISTVIVTAKLTGGGADGSMTFVNGLLTASTPAT